jgi:hypothetical protein
MAWAACAGIEHHITVLTHEEMDKVLATNPEYLIIMILAAEPAAYIYAYIYIYIYIYKVLATHPEQVLIFAAEPAAHQPRMTAHSLGDIYI